MTKEHKKLTPKETNDFINRTLDFNHAMKESIKRHDEMLKKCYPYVVCTKCHWPFKRGESCEKCGATVGLPRLSTDKLI